MVVQTRWGHIVAVMILGMAVMCSTSNAQVFLKPTSVSSDSVNGSFTPQVASATDSAGNIYVYVVWEDDTDTNSNILFSRSTDGGLTFSTPKPLSSTSGSSFGPRINVDSGGGINVVWVDDTTGNLEVFFSRSTDHGASFSSLPTQLSFDDLCDSANPQVATDSKGNIFVVWENDQPFPPNPSGDCPVGIRFTRSSSGGPFSGPAVLTTNTGGSVSPQMVVDATDNIHIVWEDDSNGASDISYTRSTNAGVSFSVAKSLSKNTGNSFNPQIAVDLGGNVSAVWENNSPGNFDVFFTRSTDNGATFPALFPLNLSNTSPNGTNNTSAASLSPQIAVDSSGSVSVLWQETVTTTPKNTDISFVRFNAGDGTFSAVQNLSNNPGSSANISLAVDPFGGVNATWEDSTPCPPGTPGNLDICFSRSTDGGAPFSTQNLSANSGRSTFAQIISDKNGNLNAVWQDTTRSDGTCCGSQVLYSRFNSGRVVNQPPAIVTQPANQTVVEGQTATFSVTASGSAPLNYQWQKNGLDISGANSASYTTPPTTAQDDGAQFAVVVTNSVDKVTSNSATLTVNSPPTILTQPADQTVLVGQMATFSVSASGTETLTYQWQKNGVDIGGANSASYTTPVTTAQDNGALFAVVVSNLAGKVTSSAAKLTVNSPSTNRPPVANAGADQTITCAGPRGTQVTLNGSASSDPDGDALSYLWMDQWGNVVGTAAVAQVTARLGLHSYTLTVTDPGGLSSTAATRVNVQDTTAPSLSVSLSPNALKPPNHKLVPIMAYVTASDGCSAYPAVKLVSITSNELDEGTGDGDQPDDIQAMDGGAIPFGNDVRAFQLRAERAGGGDGRIYTVTYSASDASGNTTTASAVVVVGADPTDPAYTAKNHGNGWGRGDRDKDKGKDGDKKSNKGHDDDDDKDRGKHNDKDHKDKDSEKDHGNDRDGHH